MVRAATTGRWEEGGHHRRTARRATPRACAREAHTRPSRSPSRKRSKRSQSRRAGCGTPSVRAHAATANSTVRARAPQCDGEVHVRRGEVGLQVDRRAEVVERRRVLPRIEVHEAQVVGHDPLERVQVQRALQARDGLRATHPRVPRRTRARQIKSMSNRKRPRTATYRFFPKKHIPMLFHSCAELGVWIAATRYFTSATSMSLWSCMMDPAARIVCGARRGPPPPRVTTAPTQHAARARVPSRSSGHE